MKKLILPVILAGLSSLALANQVTLINTSKHDNLLQVSYQLAYQQHGHTTYGAIQSKRMHHGEIISFQQGKHRLAGVVVTAIDGHQLPASAKVFAAPQSCTVATSRQHRYGTILLNESAHKITCAVH